MFAGKSHDVPCLPLIINGSRRDGEFSKFGSIAAELMACISFGIYACGKCNLILFDLGYSDMNVLRIAI